MVNVVREVSKIIDNIKSVYCEKIHAIVENNTDTNYKVNDKVTPVIGKEE